MWYDCERTETISETVVSAVAEHKSCDAAELPPLTDYADPDALDALFGNETPSTPAITRGSLEFKYGNVSVEISSVGKVVVQDS